MRVLQVHNFYRIKGGECGVVELENKLLTEAGHEVVPYYKNSQHIDRLSVIKRIRSFLDIPYNQEIYQDVIERFSHDKPDVAHVHNVFPLISPSVYSALYDLGIPIVQTVHNFRFLCPNGVFFTDGNICEECQEKGYFSAVRKKCVRNNYGVSALYASAVSRLWKSGVMPGYFGQLIALNRFFAKKLSEAGIPEEKISICGNFITPLDFKPVDKQPYILYLGRLSPEKGIQTLLEAMALNGDVTLKIAGSGPDESFLCHEVERRFKGRVHLLGHVSGDEKNMLIAQAQCMIVPSEWYENFPISVVEAMSFGTPVIASDTGGLSDMVKHNETGLLFTPGDSEQLAGCIHKMLSNPEKLIEMSERAREYAKVEFGAKLHLGRLLDIYQRAMNMQLN